MTKSAFRSQGGLPKGGDVEIHTEKPDEFRKLVLGELLGLRLRRIQVLDYEGLYMVRRWNSVFKTIVT